MRQLCKWLAVIAVTLIVIALLLFGAEAPGYARATVLWLRERVATALAPRDAPAARPLTAAPDPVQAGDSVRVPFRPDARPGNLPFVDPTQR